AARGRRDCDDRTRPQGNQSDSTRRGRRRTEGRRGFSRVRCVQLHHGPDHRRRRRTDHRMSAPSPYASRPWTRCWDYWVRSNLSYPGRSLYDVLAISAVERPDKAATQFLGAQLTYAELKRRADALAASLAKMGITKGDRVGIMLPNCPQ